MRSLAAEHGGSTGRMIVGFTQKEELDEHTKETSEGRIVLILNPNFAVTRCQYESIRIMCSVVGQNT